MSVTALRYGSDAWKLLRGVSAIYKPGDMDVDRVLHKISTHLSDDLNAMERRRVTADGLADVTSETEHKTSVVKVENQLDYSDHPLVLGPGFVPQDFDLEVNFSLFFLSSKQYIVLVFARCVVVWATATACPA